MAVNLTYQIVRQYPWTIFLGGTQTQDAIAVGLITNGHGVYVEFYIPTAQYNATAVKNNAIGWTGSIEGIFQIAGVDGVSWSQQPNKSGELVSMVTVTVTSDSGNSTGQLTMLVGDPYTPAGAAKIAHLLAELNAAEGLTG